MGHAGASGRYECIVDHLLVQGISVAERMNSFLGDQMQLILPATEILVPEFPPW
jgi:hypothetical protein